MGQEQALRSAVGQLNEDVEGKLDRMELEPLREYIGKGMGVVSYRQTCTMHYVDVQWSLSLFSNIVF